jgi:hypothetical protein
MKSIRRELKQGFNNWVKGLRSITQSPQESHREVERKDESSPESGLRWIDWISAGRRWDQNGNWQDDSRK